MENNWKGSPLHKLKSCNFVIMYFFENNFLITLIQNNLVLAFEEMR